MFLSIIFQKFRIKQSKFRMALIYGIFYFILAFLIFIFSFLFFKKTDLLKSFIFSFFIGLLMFVAYLIKWEIVHFKQKAKQDKPK
jgi:L-asparagine transporter-like permease